MVCNSNPIPIDCGESLSYDIVRVILCLDVPEDVGKLSHRQFVDLTIRQGDRTPFPQDFDSSGASPFFQIPPRLGL
jgi:hypothetical protein